MSESKLSRRKTLRLGGLFAGAALASGAGVILATKPAFAVSQESLTASDVTGLTSDNGMVNDVWVEPDLSCSWNGLESPADSIDYTVRVDDPTQTGSDTSYSNMSTLGSATQTSGVSGMEGSTTYQWGSQLSLIGDGPWQTSDFQASSDGRNDNTETIGPIEVTIEAVINTTDGGSWTDRSTASFSVEITNEGVDFGGGNGDPGGVGGNAGTGGSA